MLLIVAILHPHHHKIPAVPARYDDNLYPFLPNFQVRIDVHGARLIARVDDHKEEVYLKGLNHETNYGVSINLMSVVLVGGKSPKEPSLSLSPCITWEGLWFTLACLQFITIINNFVVAGVVVVVFSVSDLLTSTKGCRANISARWCLQQMEAKSTHRLTSFNRDVSHRRSYR